MTFHDPHVEYGIDANGCLTETHEVNGHIVVTHYDDIPDTDVTTIGGIPCTTALRTVIDIAPQYRPHELNQLIRHCLGRNLFTVAEAMERISQPDMKARPGAILLGRALRALANSGD